MARTVIGVFDENQQIEAVVRDLLAEGFTCDEIGLVTRSPEDTSLPKGIAPDGIEDGAGIGAWFGALLGGVAGLLAGLKILPLPGWGLLIVAGPVVSALTGISLGAGAGAIAGGLIGMGVPRRQAQLYAEAVRQGGHLLLVRAAVPRDRVARAVVARYGPIDLTQRSATWRENGWNPEDSACNI